MIETKIENLVSIQRQLANGFIRCKKLIAEILKKAVSIVESVSSFTKKQSIN
jgi:hypothetical protein